MPSLSLPESRASHILGETSLGLAETIAVAKKSSRGPGRAPERKPDNSKRGTTPNAITIRGSADWYEWVKRLAARHGLKPTSFICMLLAEKAAEIGFEEQPERL